MSYILIAEDEQYLAAIIDKGLRKQGFDTARANNGQQAVQMAKAEKFDLLLLDLGLPVKDGWKVLAELRKTQPQLPVIITTAIDESEVKKVAIKYSVNDYLLKPFRFKDLLERIHNHLPT